MVDADDREVSMSNIPQGTDLDEVLAHYGVKGMKWGKRKGRRTLADSHDRERANIISGTVKSEKSTAHLTNAQLKEAIERMRLEQEFSRISGGIDKTRTQKTKAFVAKLLIDTGKQTAQQAVQSESKRLVDEQLRKARV